MRKPDEGKSASELIDGRIQELKDWRGETLKQVRAVIHEAVPQVVEEWKWGWAPVWSYDGILCTGETYKSVVKMTFAQGAALQDPSHLFNSSLEGKVRRAIDLHEGEPLRAAALRDLIREAAAFNSAKKSKKTKRTGTKRSE